MYTKILRGWKNTNRFYINLQRKKKKLELAKQRNGYSCNRLELVFARFIFKDESNPSVRVEGRGERKGGGDTSRVGQGLSSLFSLSHASLLPPSIRFGQPPSPFMVFVPSNYVLSNGS